MSVYSSEVFANIKTDSLHFGPALLVSRLFEQKPLNDIEWVKASILTLIGFAVYQTIVRYFIKTDGISNGNIKYAVDDILKFGTMLVASRFLSGLPLNDNNWMKDSASILTGFVTYNFVTAHVYDTNKLSPKHKLAADDVLKFGTMFLVSRFLTGKAFDKEWAMSSTGFIVGLLVYDYLLSSY